jgi:nucleoside-diphosphate-sugar epimerase
MADRKSDAKSDPTAIVLVTGVTGFLGGHCALHCLKHTQYQVRGTVRSLASKNCDHLKKWIEEYRTPDNKPRFELFEADLVKVGSVLSLALFLFPIFDRRLISFVA